MSERQEPRDRGAELDEALALEYLRAVFGEDAAEDGEEEEPEEE